MRRPITGRRGGIAEQPVQDWAPGRESGKLDGVTEGLKKGLKYAVGRRGVLLCGVASAGRQGTA